MLGTICGCGDICATRIRSVFVRRAIGHDLAAEKDPVYKVAADVVTPAMRAIEVARILRGVLAADMVGSAKLAETVGVADRAFIGGKVEFGTPRFIAHAGVLSMCRRALGALATYRYTCTQSYLRTIPY